ncbi:hypothetical protein L2E82_23253 [Cichorium intybus]|uniref:Uncharacterized protein n=1 Tax=Cichorium intybus TaxID=13427 RepID=A0ACB9E010_CICIN|nr:hypothetical protein L2E82_23253 [Cichorium intybus]
MPQEIKVKVSMHSQKCRKEVMKIVSKLSGVDEVSVDLQKEMLVVIGDVDPVCIATSLRKKRKVANIVSVGPYKKKEKEGNKSVALPIMYYNTPSYDGYGRFIYGYPPTRDGGGCNIL